MEAGKKHKREPKKTWKKRINPMSDWVAEEFQSVRGYNKQLAYSTKRTPSKPKQIKDIPELVDWRDVGVVSPVKDQGLCGSCWTFATAETIESQWALQTGSLTDLSEQQILDCTPNPQQCGGTGGCAGGTAELAMKQIILNGGITSEWMYPYTSYFGTNYNCHYNSTLTRPMLQLDSYVTLPENEYDPLMQAVANIGPIAVSIDASAWSAYETGVFDSCNQTNPDIDHAVQLVGYGTDPDYGDYYLVRNSWSPLWGESGYIRLRRTGDETNRCGIDITPSDGTGCKNGPPTVLVCGTCGILYDSSYPIISMKK